MTLEEAEAYYKRYNGHGFHMFREEPYRYEEFQRLEVKDQIKRIWDRELLEEYFSRLWNNPDNVWNIHSIIIDILIRHKEVPYIDRLLTEMEKMSSLDKHNRILIIETMAGRNEALEGGCMVVCQNSSYGKRMNRIMEDIMDFTCDESDNTDKHGWQNVKGRLDCAVSAYRAAYRKFR